MKPGDRVILRALPAQSLPEQRGTYEGRSGTNAAIVRLDPNQYDVTDPYDDGLRAAPLDQVVPDPGLQLVLPSGHLDLDVAMFRASAEAVTEEIRALVSFADAMAETIEGETNRKDWRRRHDHLRAALGLLEQAREGL